MPPFVDFNGGDPPRPPRPPVSKIALCALLALVLFYAGLCFEVGSSTVWRS